MGRIISENQNAFVPARAIQDNIIITHKILHAMKKRKKGKESLMAIKVDIAKAYDHVEWLLEGVMRTIGFRDK